LPPSPSKRIALGQGLAAAPELAGQAPFTRVLVERLSLVVREYGVEAVSSGATGTPEGFRR